MLSKACQYAVKALILISAHQEKDGFRLQLRTISKAIDSPPAFTSKILQALVSANIISSAKGSGGGFSISPSKIKSTKISTIVSLIDGDHLSQQCFLGLPHCSDRNPCPVHHLYAPVRKQLNEQLLNISLSEIVHDPGIRKVYLKPRLV